MGLSSKQVSGDKIDWSQGLFEAGNVEIGKPKPPPAAAEQAKPLRCPRCDSTNTKFCYYNNYSRAQPRHFCKSCRRHWTNGGTLRNVPVGGGRKNNKRRKTTQEEQEQVLPPVAVASSSPEWFSAGERKRDGNGSSSFLGSLLCPPPPPPAEQFYVPPSYSFFPFVSDEHSGGGYWNSGWDELVAFDAPPFPPPPSPPPPPPPSDLPTIS